MTTERERQLWKELVENVIRSANLETEDWLKKNGMYEEYLERVKECESSRINSETEKVL